jgi:hypothetical protein
LGALQAECERWSEAENLYLRAVGLKEELFGPDHPDVAMTLHNLAVLHAKQDRPHAARALFRRALAIFEAHLGSEHPKTRACRAELDALQGGSGG